ncbi:PD-(D/E)XK nuclease-like domain-containing protein [Microvirga sp. STR05]|uniref:PD-(D/E)XK nuclease-like domain-containing protein n=1 Tax=Hymenobacter duratus TaxID=2771356 RepID=A0ABR8JLZ2_9BACT|nr:PD-(D/E)XK nuclease-like domain-containing protein [Hymenobacter duratus]MBD2716741.1 PD-(D/E)XK nuclease-like domain-containing protein [Hymenobacter duratus]MBR7951656.1 PD-(D/E)XK nuclease-like domain-containing protein [Microvirga sp. STR05]
MFHTLTAHPGITQAEHRALPHISNTDLSNLKNEALGITRTGNPQALIFGVAFHEAVLEPHLYHAPQDLPPGQLRLLDNLAAAVRRQRYCRDLLYRGTAEVTHTAIHAETGLPVKIRPDLLVVTPRLGRKVLVDFKTTSCQDYAQFVATIEAYDYDRQAALYTDVLGADRFLIVGVQKKAPHDIWLVELSADNYSMEQGRKKYQRLLKYYAEQGQKVVAPLVQQVPTRTWAD